MTQEKEKVTYNFSDHTIVQLKKRNTTWTFTLHGAMKETKSGTQHFPELALCESNYQYIGALIEKGYEWTSAR